jgi:large subunit ribosomal protein L6
MSRIGKQPITIPESVKIKLDSGKITITGPKGTLVQALPRQVKVAQKNDQLIVESSSSAFHGLFRSLVNNMVIGVTEGYQKTLKLIGTGYRVKKEGQALELSLGFSHSIKVASIEGIELEIEGNSTIIVKGIDKQLVGQTAADIRSLRPPEPYKGKGVRYQDEQVRRKPGKAAKTEA